MALETFNFIDSLVTTNPASGDNVNQGDDHIRGVKTTLKNSFPNVDGAVNPTPAEFNRLVGVTENIQPKLDDAASALAAIQALDPKQQPSYSSGTDTDHDIDFTAGKLLIGSQPIDTNAFTKELDNTWAAGDDAGGLADALTPAANTAYFLHALSNADGTNTDWGFDTSQTATNLLADTSVIADGLTIYRPVGVLQTDASSNFRAFTLERLPTGEDFIRYDTEITFISTASLSTGGVTGEDGCPDGILLNRRIRFMVGRAATVGDFIITFGNGGVPTYTALVDDYELMYVDADVANSTFAVAREKSFATNDSTFGFDADNGFCRAQANTIGYGFNRQEL